MHITKSWTEGNDPWATAWGMELCVTGVDTVLKDRGLNKKQMHSVIRFYIEYNFQDGFRCADVSAPGSYWIRQYAHTIAKSCKIALAGSWEVRWHVVAMTCFSVHILLYVLWHRFATSSFYLHHSAELFTFFHILSKSVLIIASDFSSWLKRTEPNPVVACSILHKPRVFHSEMLFCLPCLRLFLLPQPSS